VKSGTKRKERRRKRKEKKKKEEDWGSFLAFWLNKIVKRLI
jgi:hypothetical protein